MNKIKLFISILFIFLLLNVIIVFLWQLRTTIKFNNFKPYSDQFTNSLNLSEKDALKLYLETWQRERLFVYDEFTGLKESEITDGKYVNISAKDGRKIQNNPDICKKNIFFYGGEIVFGYDATDSQSIPFYFREILFKNNLDYCVFNFGRKSYYSTQENILLQKHLIKNKIKENDIVIFLNGENENGSKNILNTDFIDKNYNELHQKYWNLYKAGIKYFFDLLPIKQFFEVLINKKILINNYDDKVSNQDLNDIKFVFQKNLDIRKSICEMNKLECFNFLFFSNINNNLKFEKIKGIKNIFDLSNIKNQFTIINKFGSLNPEYNKLIAEEMFKKIID